MLCSRKHGAQPKVYLSDRRQRALCTNGTIYETVAALQSNHTSLRIAGKPQFAWQPKIVKSSRDQHCNGIPAPPVQPHAAFVVGDAGNGPLLG